MARRTRRRSLLPCSPRVQCPAKPCCAWGRRAASGARPEARYRWRVWWIRWCRGKRSKVAKEHSRGAWRIRQAREKGRRKRGPAESSGERKKGGGGPWHASRSQTGSRHDCGGGFGDSFSVRVELRDSIQPAASLSFSDTSRKNCAVRFSVSGATSSFTKLFTRASSSSTRFPKSSKLLIF